MTIKFSKRALLQGVNLLCVKADGYDPNYIRLAALS